MSQIFPNSFCPGKLRKNHGCTEVQAPRIPMSAGEKEKQHSAGMGVWFRWARLISDTLTPPHLSTSQVVLLERLSRIFVQYSGSYILLSMCRFPLPCIPNTAIAMPAWTSSSNSWKGGCLFCLLLHAPKMPSRNRLTFPIFQEELTNPSLMRFVQSWNGCLDLPKRGKLFSWLFQGVKWSWQVDTGLAETCHSENLLASRNTSHNTSPFWPS